MKAFDWKTVPKEGLQITFLEEKDKPVREFFNQWKASIKEAQAECDCALCDLEEKKEALFADAITLHVDALDAMRLFSVNLSTMHWKLRKNVVEWAKANMIGKWRPKVTSRPGDDGTPIWSIRMQFLNERDATLFKLFWFGDYSTT